MATETATKKAEKTEKAPAKKAVAKKASSKKTAQSGDFAVIATGGKQYVVSPGDVIDVELIGDHKEGDKVEFDQVLMQNDKVGTPTVSGAKVKATFLKEKKGKKLSIIRFKAKSNRSRKVGHRQQYAQVQIDSI